MSNNVKQAFLNKSRADKFLLSISLPPALRKINKKSPKTSSNIALDSLQFSVYGAVVPAIDIPTKALVYGGHESGVQVSSHFRKAPEPLKVSFNVDNNYWNYWVIWTWLNLLNDAVEGTFDTGSLVTRSESKNEIHKMGGGENGSLGIHKEYSANMSLHALDEYNNKKIEFNYIGAFPTMLDGITYDYQKESEIISGVTFSYTKMAARML
jgi:hypothetical protein